LSRTRTCDRSGWKQQVKCILNVSGNSLLFYIAQ